MVKLVGQLYAVSGDKITHTWDASAYLISGDEPTLIDCGSVNGYDALKRNLKALGYEPKHIKRVIATHGHWDHVSAMAQLKEESDAELWIHEADRKQVETGDWNLTSAFLYDVPFPAVKADGELKDGSVLEVNGYQLHIHHTPGHSPGSVCIWMEIDGLKILIAGDTLWGGYHAKVGSDLEAWKCSLDRLLELDFDAYTFGHCPPNLYFDAKTIVREARQQLGIYFSPWFKPFHTKFRY
jgi:hydroxyacylglutathione hydrolase